MRLLCALLISLGLAVCLFFQTAFPPLPDSHTPVRIYSNQLRDDLKCVLLHAFRQATRSIYIQIYSLTDEDILTLLKQKSIEGVSVTAFYDPSASPHLDQDLSPYGISALPVKITALMHRKIFVIDDKWTYLGTANLTTQSLRMHDNVMLGIESVELADFCSRSVEPYKTFQVGSTTLTLFLLPDSRTEALNHLLSALSYAQKEVNCALFTLTHPQIVEALCSLKTRGVEVNVAIDYYSRRGASQKAILKLEENGVTVKESLGQQLLHHKWALIDQSTLLLGSANWTSAAFRNNQDFVILASPLDASLVRALKKIWKVLETESL